MKPAPCAWCGIAVDGFCSDECAQFSREHNEWVEQRNAEADSEQGHRVRGNQHDRDLAFLRERATR